MLMRPMPRVGGDFKNSDLYSNRSTAVQHDGRDSRETAVWSFTHDRHRTSADGNNVWAGEGTHGFRVHGKTFEKNKTNEKCEKNITQTVLNKWARVLRLAETGRPCYGDSTATAKEAMSARRRRRRRHGTTTAIAAGSDPRQRCWRQARIISRKTWKKNNDTVRERKRFSRRNIYV